jgi:hypothetical protein
MTPGPDYGQQLPRIPSGYGRSASIRVPPPVEHKGANAAQVLGIVSLVSYLTAFMFLITAPGVLCAPVAWAIGAHAMNQIDHSTPDRYGNRRAAMRGMLLGIVITVLAPVTLAAVVVLYVILAREPLG